MIKLNTSCEKCYFAHPASSEKPCDFYIPDVVQDTKKLEIINDFYYIHQYRCKYGVSKETAEGQLKNFDVDIHEYAKHQVVPKYVLYVKTTTPEAFERVCTNLIKLAIPPQFVHLVFDYDFNITNIQQTADKILTDANFRWKLHRFLEEKKDWQQLYVSLSTDQNVAKSDFIWILNDQMLDIAIENDYINKINFIINVQQPDLGILTNHLSDNYFYGIFMTLDNLDGIWQHVNYDIDTAIRTLYTNDVGFYD
jgi:hypothetical protein